MRRSIIAAVQLVISISPVRADDELQAYLEQGLAWLRHRDNNPAIAALVEIDGKIAAQAAVGVRAADHPQSTNPVSLLWERVATTDFTACYIS